MSHKRYLSTPGTLTVVTGGMGSGKTDIALRFTEAIIKKNPDIHILTNIVMKRKSRKYPITVITKLTQLIDQLVELERVHLILDEAGIFATSGNSGRKRDTGQWEQFIKLSRKFGVSIMWIDQRGMGSVPPTMRALSNFHIHKPELFIYEMWQGFKGHEGAKRIETRKLTSKDRTDIPFDTGATGSFIMDLPEIDGYQLTIRDLFDKTANVNSNQIRSTIKEWMKEININMAQERLSKERVLEAKEKKGSSPAVGLREVVFFILDEAKKRGLDPPKTSTIAEILGRKPPSISRLKKEWNDSSTSLEKDIRDLDSIINDIDEVLAEVS